MSNFFVHFPSEDRGGEPAAFEPIQSPYAKRMQGRGNHVRTGQQGGMRLNQRSFFPT